MFSLLTCWNHVRLLMQHKRTGLKILLAELPLPAVGIKMKETLMLVIDTLVEQDRGHRKRRFISLLRNDILRYFVV